MNDAQQEVFCYAGRRIYTDRPIRLSSAVRA